MDVFATTFTVAQRITPNDSNLVPSSVRALYVDTAGSLAIVDSGGNAVTFAAVVVGLLPIAVSIVKSAGTTATVVGLS